MLSCLDFFKKPNKPVTGLKMSTLDLKDLIDTCASDERAIPIITALTKEKPLASNYLIRNNEALYMIRPSEFCESVYTIAQHIKFKDLEPCCKLFLSVEQANYMIQLEALKKELASRAKPSIVSV